MCWSNTRTGVPVALDATRKQKRTEYKKETLDRACSRTRSPSRVFGAIVGEPISILTDHRLAILIRFALFSLLFSSGEPIVTAATTASADHRSIILPFVELLYPLPISFFISFFFGFARRYPYGWRRQRETAESKVRHTRKREQQQSKKTFNAPYRSHTRIYL